jgi:hypothetical protein
MPRADLLALTADDLAALTNRGTVKRAQREIEAGEYTGEVAEAADGTVTAKWSDGADCGIPAGAVLRDAHCSCAAAGLCRHLVRTVLAYQQQASQSAGTQQAASAGPWDPGEFTDDDLQRHYRPAGLARLRAEFEQGVLVELVRSSKPSVRFHLQGCVIRFQVRGDLRYTHCDCAEAAPCGHVPLAVWAFRLLDPARSSGILATGERAPPAPVALLDDLERAALEFAEYGASGAPPAWVDRLRRLEEACRDGDLVWPAEVLAEWVEQQERYARHDALFAADRLADLIGELLVRCDAVRNDTGALPQLLIRGASADRAMTLGAARFVGLGCGVRAGHKRVELTAYLQDADSGSVVAVRRDFAEEETETPKPFGELALTAAVKRTSFAALGAGQLLLRGGKRTAGFRLLPARAEASVQPQAFAWEALRAPALVEDYAELDARLGALPPASLRPRRVAEDFHVCPVRSVEAVHFDGAAQSVRAVLLDAGGRRLCLEHPFHSRGQEGVEALLAKFALAAQELRFVSGQVRRGPQGLVVRPVCLVWQDGAARTAIQPWVERRPAGAPAGEILSVPPHAPEPLGEFLRRLQEELGELFVLGLGRADARAVRRWQELHQLAESIGSSRMSAVVAELASLLSQKSHTLRWDWQPAARALLRLAVLARASQDLVSV